MRHLNVVLPIIAASLLMLSCTRQHRVTEERITSTEHVHGSAIAVKTDNGAVEIIADPGMGESVQIAAKITCAGKSEEEAAQRMADTRLVIERDAQNVLNISAQFAGTRRGNDAVAFTIRVPHADGVDVRTGNGRIQITGLSGKATLNTSNGAMTIIEHQGDADLSTSNGKIIVDRMAGNLKAKTSNGEVNVTGLDGTAHIRTMNGKVSLALHPDQTGPIDVRTSNGRIHATVGHGFVGRVKFHTANGTLQLNEGKGDVKSKELKKSSGVATIGEGGGESSLESSNGSITFDIVQ